MSPLWLAAQSLALALAIVAAFAGIIVLVRSFVGRRTDDLPPDLLDELAVHPAGEWLELSGRLYGGRRVRFKVDRRHAHVLSDDLLRATMKHYGAKLTEKGNGDGSPSVPN